MPDRRTLLAGIAALPAAPLTGLPPPADPLAALWAEFQALRAALYAAARTDADWDAAHFRLYAMEGQALDMPATGLGGAAAAVAWARDEYANSMNGATDLDRGEQLILVLLDTALAALRDAAFPIARCA